MEKHVYFIRHGESSHNADGNRLSGIGDVSMTDVGRQACRKLARFFDSRKLGAVFSSQLCRARETASLVFPNGAEAVVRAELMEFDYGEFDGVAIETLPYDHPVAVQWRGTPGEMTFPGGQSIREFADESFEGVTRVIRAAEATRIACIVHKTMGRLFVAKTIGLELNGFRKIPMDNCSVTEFRFREDRGFVLQSLNLTLEHLVV